MPSEITIDHAADMSEFWRLISAEGQDDDHRIYGTWWVSTDHVKPIDVTIWDRRSDYGRVLYSDALTAFREPGGEIRLPTHMIRSTILADCEAAWGLLLAVIKAATDADRPAQPTVQPSAESVARALFLQRYPGSGGWDGPGWEKRRGPWLKAAEAVLALIGGRTEAEAVKGVQQWMALDLHMALGHGVEPPAAAEHDWADWWARLLAEVRERRTEAEVRADTLEEAAEYAEYSGLHITLLDEPRSVEKWTSITTRPSVPPERRQCACADQGHPRRRP